jgi:hypothetical protein
MDFKPNMYKVSPTPNPTTPLTTTTATTGRGNCATAPANPETSNTSTRTAAFVAHRMIFAEKGDTPDSAFLYIMGATAQLIAAPKAANSPIIPDALASELLKAAAIKVIGSRKHKGDNVCSLNRESKKPQEKRKPTSFSH